MDAQALGRFLQQTREAKEITLEDAEGALRIRRRILESFELGDFNIPDSSAIQIRGFMRNYARFLGLDDDRVISLYDAALIEGSRPRRTNGRKRKKNKRETQSVIPAGPRAITDTQPVLPVPPAVSLVETRPQRGFSLLNLVLRLLVGLAALSVIVFVGLQLTGVLDQDTVIPDAPAGDLLTLPPSPIFTPSPTLQVALLPTIPPEDAQSAFTGEGVLVTIEFTQRSWVRLSTDGVEQFVGIVRPGTTMEYAANNNVTINASNAEALNVIYNGQQQPLFGGRGQYIDIVFSTSGVSASSAPGFDPTPEQSPTPLPTPTDPAGAIVSQLTPTNTPGPSPTPSDTPTMTLTPTETLTPSLTPTPSDTPTITLTPTETLTPSNTPSPTLTPSSTLTPTNTLTPSNTPIPSPTAILPPRVTPVDVTPTKVGA